MLSTAGLLRFVHSSENVLPNKPLSNFPTRIDEWSGNEQRFDQKIYEVLGVDDSYLATYSTPDGKEVQLYIGFYRSQKEGDIIHSPKNCMPGAGWKIVKSSIEVLDVPETVYKKFKVIKLTTKNGIHEQMVLYWYQSRGRVISSEYMQKIYLVADSVFRNRTDGSFVRLITQIHHGEEKQASQILKSFASKIFPILIDFLPS
jgi:EpsI family protein